MLNDNEISCELKVRISKAKTIVRKSFVRFATRNIAMNRMRLKSNEHNLAANSLDQPGKAHIAERKG